MTDQERADHRVVELTQAALNGRLGDAWEAGFAQGHQAGLGLDYADNPYRAPLCAIDGCNRRATAGRQVCAEHFRTLTDLIAPYRSSC